MKYGPKYHGSSFSLIRTGVILRQVYIHAILRSAPSDKFDRRRNCNFISIYVIFQNGIETTQTLQLVNSTSILFLLNNKNHSYRIRYTIIYFMYNMHT